MQNQATSNQAMGGAKDGEGEDAPQVCLACNQKEGDEDKDNSQGRIGMFIGRAAAAIIRLLTTNY